MQSIHKKIEREKALIHAANAMRSKTDNDTVRSRLDSQMRDARRNLQYFEEKINELQMRRLSQNVGDMSLAGSSRDGGPAPPPKDEGDLMPPRGPFANPGPAGIPKPRPNFSKLGVLIPHTLISVHLTHSQGGLR